MPELVVDIPKSFLQSTKELVETVRKFTATVGTLTKNIDTGKVQIQQALPEAKFLQLARRLESMSSGLERDLHRIMSLMGPLGQSFFRGMTFSETIITGIGRVAGIAGMVVIGTGVAAREGFQAIRYLWDKIVSLGDFMFQDYLVSSGMQTTIGGLRAFRTSFFGLPLDPAMNMNFAISQVNTASRQMNALRILGVSNITDNAEMMVQATLAAARFMKAQPKGNSLLNAHYIGLTTLFSPEYLTALEKMNAEELDAAARKFEVNRSMMELSEKAVEGWKNFNIQVKIAGAQIVTVIGEKLAQSNITAMLTEISKTLVKLFKDIMDMPITKELIDNVTDDFKAWANAFGGTKAQARISNFTKQGNEFRDALKFVLEQLFRMQKNLGMTIEEPKEVTPVSSGTRYWQRKFGPTRGLVGPDEVRPGSTTPRTAPGTSGPTTGDHAYARPPAQSSPPVTFRKGVRTHPEKFAHDRDFSKDSAGQRLDPNVFAQAENIAKTGDVDGVYKFITAHGGHVDYNYCGDFVGAVIKAEGGKPPPGYPIATSWANYGTPVKPGEEKPGDIAIYMRGHRPGETGGHVGIVGSQGALGNGKFQFFGANNTNEYITSEDGVIFRRPPAVGPPPDPRSLHRYRPVIGQREQAPTAQSPSVAAPSPTTQGGRAPVELRPFSHPEEPLTTPPGWTPLSTEPGSGVRQFPRADVNNAIDHASATSGISRDSLYAIAHIESGGNPDQRTGSYSGLFQLSEAEFRKYGGQGSINDPEENARVAALKLKDERDQVSQQLGRPLTDSETYLVHQQGVGAAPIHLTHPDQPAWQSMYQTAEGQQKGEAWAKRAIWGNLPADERARFGSVDNVTSGDFVSFWHRRFLEKGGQPGYGNGIPWQPPAQKGWPTSKEEDDRAEKAATEKQTGPNLISPIPGVDDFSINSSGVFGASRSGGGRLHSGNDLHGPTGSPAVSMNDGTVLYNGWNQGYNANIVIKGDDGVIRRYAVHGATEPLPVGSRVTQGQRIGTIGEGHIHYEEIPPTKDGQPNPVYQEMVNSPGRFVSTTQERGTVDPSGPQGTLQYIGRNRPGAPEVKKDVPTADKAERGVKAKPIPHLNAPFSAGGDEKARKAAEDHPVNKFAIKNQSDSDLAWMSNP